MGAVLLALEDKNVAILLFTAFFENDPIDFNSSVSLLDELDRHVVGIKVVAVDLILVLWIRHK